MPRESNTSKIDRAYQERDRVIALAAGLAMQAGHATWVSKVNDPIEDVTHAVYIDLPEGQVSWHIRDNELPWFDHLPRDKGTWSKNGRNKYTVIADFCDRIRTGGPRW